MWSFDGEYKKKPVQRLGGASKLIDRNTLLSKLKAERSGRENQRKQESAAVTIQSWWRSCHCRWQVKNLLRGRLNVSLKLLKQEFQEDTAEEVLRYLFVVFSPVADSSQALEICQLFVLHQTEFLSWICHSIKKWTYYVCKLICLSFSVISRSLSDGMLAPSLSPLRLVEIVTAFETWDGRLSHKGKTLLLSTFYGYLIKSVYYKTLVQLLEHKVPEIYESSPHPPTPFADSLLILVLQPVEFYVLTDGHYDHLYYAIGEIVQHLFTHSLSSQIHNFVIPAMASRGIINNKVFTETLIKFLYLNMTELMQRHKAVTVMYPLLRITHERRELGCEGLQNYISVVTKLLNKIPSIKVADLDVESDLSDDDDDAMEPSVALDPAVLMLVERCSQIINSTEHVTWLLNQVEKNLNQYVILLFSQLTHQLLMVPGFKLQQSRLLYSVVTRVRLVRMMWGILISLKRDFTLYNQSEDLEKHQDAKGLQLLVLLARGTPLNASERDLIIPLLTTFCAALFGLLSTLHDSELLGTQRGDQTGVEVNHYPQFPFSISELITISANLKDVCVGLSELSHPDVRTSFFLDPESSHIWLRCFEVCVLVVRHIHSCDTRRCFCPESHWLTSRLSLPQKSNQLNAFLHAFNHTETKLFLPQRWHTKDELICLGLPLPLSELRRGVLLRNLPFVFPFEDRTHLFSHLLSEARSESQFTAQFNVGPSINLTIRRTHIYEDAFEKLFTNKEPNMRLKMRIRLLNSAGLDEAGIDGGGIFREFLSELLKTAFDPTRGFFIMTKENTLYPNPGAHIVTDDFQNHYYFIGQMLGKAIFENLLVEIPLAGFFLSKLLSKSSSSIEFCYLDSLDPELSKNLLSLKTYQGDVSDMGLDFTVLNSELGQNSIQELIPNGANITVTNENRIEYIYRVADYKLNKQIQKHSIAFRNGVFDVITADWLNMFDWKELQMLISGANVMIDVEDLKENTKYAGEYSSDHKTIIFFWRVVEDLTEEQKSQLLKFVTSCSRPPLLGFKDLNPSFCIQPSGDASRLPSASTCMNLLKLPMYEDAKTLNEKLLLAITSGAGFELS